MITGIGTDLVEIARIEQLLTRRGESFIRRILTDSERDECARCDFPERFLAKRWAAKEAVVKAMGTGFTQGVSFQGIDIVHTDAGQPQVALSGATRAHAERLGIERWSLSLSDERHYALAFAVAEGGGMAKL
ncbi:holo-ACP synthase [Thiomicrospira sp. WB1]|uniref:holo-ACP synthase n=1 Tax=Thiomicrospira sp. WB1 TaxID=1685380 RepID=UPI000747C352|nr:holo-ACP synthase [Thiomicrospira sp. WB1]KUJ71887.1 ACP synthase [Thiomicrospira sp. WB1]